MVKYKNKYRIPSTRLQNRDYGAGSYFITICTKNRKHYFGEIIFNNAIVETPCMASPPMPPQSYAVGETRCIASLRPTEIGKIVKSEWEKTIELRPNMNLKLGEFVVMPNHFHGIITIGGNQFNGNDAMHGVCTNVHTNATAIKRGCGDAMHRVSTNNVNKFGPQSNNLGSIIRGFKSSITTYAKKNKIEFAWQARYHDHLIRDQAEYLRISNYIVNNPINWRNDNFYSSLSP